MGTCAERWCKMSRLKDFALDRIGWETYLKPFMCKELPADLGWPATLGTLCVLLFVVQAVTGILLAMYYNPSPDKAYESIHYIMNDVYMGRVLHGIHHWSAGAMVIAVFLHMLTNFFSGSFKAPRELTWMVGVCLFLVTLGLGLTGYLLPWDQKAYWATVVSTNVPGDIPVVGEFIRRLLLAGDRVSGLTLTRFYAIHMLALPALILFLAAFHIYLVRIHGVAAPPESLTSERKPVRRQEDSVYRFFPDHLAKSAVLFALVFAVIFLLAVFAKVPREQIAGSVDESYLPRPEWYFMWLFQVLTYFSGSTEKIGSIAVPLGMALVLFALPFLSKSNLRAISDRPLATAFGVSCIAGIVFLTLMGLAGARPYGEIVIVPDKRLTPPQARGLHVFVERECAYCHQILGKGGRREGPDLSNVVAKKRTKEWLAKYIKDPKSVSKWTTMPKYDLSEEELNDLTEFILSLDFAHHHSKIIPREEVIKKGTLTLRK
jgi:quinol-cytochrome oxidoreductase complex cytochrome b subunit